MRVYHFLPAKWGLKAIQQRRLKVARLDFLNDPFELEWSMGTRDDRKAFRSYKKDMGKTFGLLCFSKNHYNPVQWAHYAERHKGLCLAFEIPKTDLHEVKYEDRRGDIDFLTLATNEPDEPGPLTMRIWTTKYRHWEYEREWRNIIALNECQLENGLYFSAFGPRMKLAKVLVGARSPITRAELAYALGSMTKVEAYKVRPAFRTFRMTKDKLAKRWK